jgi:predicted phage tail protein
VTLKRIQGSGGEEEGGRPPREERDSLKSSAFIRVVDLLTEGEIEGLVDGEKSIYLNETPLVNADGSRNFTAGVVSYEERTGTQSQSYMAGFDSVQNEIQAGQEFRFGEVPGGTVVRQITNPNVDRVRIRVSIPTLSSTNIDNGDVSGTSVTVQLSIQPNGGSYAVAATRTVSGKSSSKYEFTMSAELTGSAPWNIKIQRLTPDATSQYLLNKTYLESYTEIIDAKLRYPNSALIGMRVSAEQFSSIPSRYYHVGLLKIRVPSNYDPETREYTGSWDGTFQLSSIACDNPAWIFYDLVTSERYGLGKFIPDTQIDKWTLYEIGRYCDELVPDGFGGMEPRFTCNTIIQGREEAYNVLQNLASVFRGMIYWAAGAVTFAQDSPKDPTYLFTSANVIDGKFTYQGSSAKTRHSVAIIAWNDPDDFYRQKFEYVEDQDAIAKFGIIETEIVAFGCTSRGQANRLGKWLLYTEQYESETVTFKTGLDGAIVRPGQVIQIQDPMRSGLRIGGRISSATTSTVTIDQDLSGSYAGYTISALLPGGTVESREVTGYAGRVVSVSPAFSVAPNPHGAWAMRSDDIELQQFRVVGVKEEEGGQFSVSAMAYDPDKYAAVEQGLKLEPKAYSVLSSAPGAAANVKIGEILYQTASEVKTKVVFSWDRVDFAVSYLVRYKIDDNNWVELIENSFNEAEVLDAPTGVYTVEVTAVSSLGKRGATSSATKEIFGKTAPPFDVTGFSMLPGAGVAQLSWDRATDLDVIVGGSVRIRHTPKTTGAVWKDSVDIVPAVAGTATTAIAPLLSGTYMIKFLDSSGNYSENESLIVTTVPDSYALNVVETVNEHPDFGGVKTSMTLDTLENALVLASNSLWDELGLIDSLGSLDFPGDIAPEGTYDFEDTVDLGSVWPARIRTLIDLEAFDIGNLWDQRVELMDTWSDIDGSIVNDVDAQLYIRTTEDDPGASPTWTVWKRIASGEYTARAFQFQLRMTSANENHNGYIRQLGVTVDMADRVENLGPIASGTSVYSVAYQYPFYEPPAISITAINLQSGDYWAISNQTRDGFDIEFKNSAATTVNRSFYVVAKGYGFKVA